MSERCVDTILNMLPFAAYWRNGDDQVETYNQPFLEMIGIENDENGRTEWLPDKFAFLGPDEMRELRRIEEVALTSSARTAHCVLERYMPGAGRVWLRADAHAMPSGEFEGGVLVICRNITEQEQGVRQLKLANLRAEATAMELEEHLRQTEQLRRQAEEANRVKSDFLANISHELRTPMNGIIGLMELATDTGLNAEQSELVTAALRSARNLMSLLNDILDISKIEAGEMTLESTTFDLHATTRGATNLFRALADKKGILLECSVADNVPRHVVGDPGRIQQILNNLIGNAVKFTDDGRVRILVDLTHVGDPAVIRFTIEDSGIGIPKNKQGVIFNKFMQADLSTSRKYGGTGLGLAITKQLIDAMSGHISLFSEPGRGATFTVELPLELAPEESLVTQSERTGDVEAPDTLEHRRARILVVDDHPVNLLFMCKALKKIGIPSPDEAVSGREAIDLVSKNDYDLIFMDCQMPDIDGFEAARQIRAMDSETKNRIPIIAVTADAMKGAQERCLGSGMNGYVSKPIELPTLKSILREWLPESPLSVETAPVPLKASLAPPLVDWSHFESFTENDPEQEQELIHMFLQHGRETLNALISSVAAKDYDLWKSSAHRLKGSAANLGATVLASVCAEAESCGQGAEREQILQMITHHFVMTENALIRRIDASARAARSAQQA